MSNVEWVFGVIKASIIVSWVLAGLAGLAALFYFTVMGSTVAGVLLILVFGGSVGYLLYRSLRRIP